MSECWTGCTQFLALCFFQSLLFKHHPSQFSCRPESSDELPNPDTILYTCLTHSQHQACHLQPPVTLPVPAGSFDILVFSLCPSSQELIFSWMSCIDQGSKQSQMGETKWGAVRFGPKDCKNFAGKGVLPPYLMLRPLVWVCISGQLENVTLLTLMCSRAFVEYIMWKMDN